MHCKSSRVIKISLPMSVLQTTGIWEVVLTQNGQRLYGVHVSGKGCDIETALFICAPPLMLIDTRVADTSSVKETGLLIFVLFVLGILAEQTAHKVDLNCGVWQPTTQTALHYVRATRKKHDVTLDDCWMLQFITLKVGAQYLRKLSLYFVDNRSISFELIVHPFCNWSQDRNPINILQLCTLIIDFKGSLAPYWMSCTRSQLPITSA